MAIAAGVYQGSLCENRTAIQGYFFHAYPQIYNMNYFDGGYIGFLAEFLNYYCTFHWTFMDIFIVATSICLSTRLAQFNAFLLQYKGIVSINKIELIKCSYHICFRQCQSYFGQNNAIPSH